MKNCTYTYKDKSGLTYQDLVKLITESDIDSIADILYSRDIDYQAITDRNIEEFRSKKAPADYTKGRGPLTDESPDFQVGQESITTQAFINSNSFYIGNGNERPIFKLSDEEYMEMMKKSLIQNENYNEEQAAALVQRAVDHWGDINNDAQSFHRWMMAGPQLSGGTLSAATANTRFSAISGQVQTAKEKIFNKVFHPYKNDRSGYIGDSIIKTNVNLEAELKGMAETLFGHIDYIVIRPDGTLEVTQVKTSTQPFSRWSTVKKEHYKYQLALLKRMLISKGIDPRKIRLNILPVWFKYNDDFTQISDIEVGDVQPMDEYQGTHNFQHYDQTAAQFIEAQVQITEVPNEALDIANGHIQHIFPGANIESYGVKQTAKDWLNQNWGTLQVKYLPNGEGLTVMLPASDGSQTFQEVTVRDTRKAGHNEELVTVLEGLMTSWTDPAVGQLSTRNLMNDIKDIFLHGWFTSRRLKGNLYNYISTQFSKYLEGARPIKVDGKEQTVYNWAPLEHPALEAANILALQNKTTGQIDFFTISSVSPTTKYSFKGRKNLLGAHIMDLNSDNFTLQCNYGNMEAIRTMAIINQIAPWLGGDAKLGQLRVIGLNPAQQQQGAFYEFDSLMKEWSKIVRIVNKNTPAGIENNFQKYNISSIPVENILRQTWLEIINDDGIRNVAEIKALGDIIDYKITAEGLKMEGLMGMTTIEGKVQKLEALLSQLQNLADSYGLPIADAKAMLDARHSRDKQKAAIATLFVLTSQALSRYYGDVQIENESFSEIQETFVKTTSISNTYVRQVGYLVQKSIDNIRGNILDAYMPNVLPLFKKFYEDAGYTSFNNATWGSQASVYENLYKPDENGKNTYQFKNPYDPDAELEDYERDFLKKILFEFYKVRQAAHHMPLEVTSSEDPKLLEKLPAGYLNVPLQKASAATRRLKLGKRLKTFGKRLYRRVTNPSETFEEMQGFLDGEDITQRDVSVSVYNRYTISDSTGQSRDRMIIDCEEKYGADYFETNLENIFIDYLSEQVKVEEFNKLLMRIRGIELSLMLQGIAEGDEEKIMHTIKTIEDYITINLHNKSIMEPTAQKLDVFMNPIRKLVSSLYIAANPVASVRDTFQGLQENFLQAAIKYQTDIGMADVAFGYAQVFKEGATNIMSMTKLNQFNIKYGFSNFDAAKVAERLKTGRGGLLNWENMAYWTLRAPDYLNRMVLFCAKLHHDGIWGAYSLNEEHRLVYDWRLDKRFDVYATGDTENAKYNEQRALYYSLIREFNMETGSNLAYSDDLPDAYTPGQIRAIKTLGESIYGAYDQSSKAKAGNLAIGRNFMFFSTWLNGIVDNYGKKTQISQSELRAEQETDYNGNPLFFTPDGSGTTTTEDTGLPVTKHVPIMVQGILWTFWDFMKEAKHSGWDISGTWKNFMENDVHRRNFKRAGADMVIWLLLGWLFKQWLASMYKEHKKEDDGRDVMINLATEWIYKGYAGSLDTFKGPFAVLEYLGDQTNPATYKVSSKLINDAWNVVTGNKTLMETAMTQQAFLRSMQDTYKMYMRDVHPKDDD